MQAAAPETIGNSTAVLAPVKVLYIAGAGRSGSTLLDRLLGLTGAFSSTGELKQFWSPGYIDKCLCSCGKYVRECEFWNAVMREAYGGWDRVDLLEAHEAWMAMCNPHRFRYLWMPFLDVEKQQRELKVLARYWGPMYRAILKISSAKVVVDSSKSPMGAYFLNQDPNVELYVLHLIRDSRAVAHSFKRKKQLREQPDSEGYMLTMSLWRACMSWNANNLMAQKLASNNPRYYQLQYSDLIDHTREKLAEIGKFVGTPTDLNIFVDDDRVMMKRGHTVAGNSDRFNDGEIALQLDDEWKRKMPWLQRLAATALTSPLLHKFGYFKGGRENPS